MANGSALYMAWRRTRSPFSPPPLPHRLHGPNLSGSRAHGTVILLFFFLCVVLRFYAFGNGVRGRVRNKGEGSGVEVTAERTTTTPTPRTATTTTRPPIRKSAAATIDMEDSAESTVNPISQQGCGPHPHISIHISPTTGGDFYLTVEPDITVENLKKLVSKKLKVPRDRICLLFRDKWVLDFQPEKN